MKAIRITPTKVDGLFYINELVKDAKGHWKNAPAKDNIRARPTQITATTTVHELMAALA